MIDLHELLWGFSIVSLVLFSIRRIRSLMMSVAVGHDPSAFSPSPRPLSTFAKVLAAWRGPSPVSPSFLPETPESLASARGEISILGNRSADREGQTSSAKLDESRPAKYDNLFTDEQCRELRKRPARLILPENFPVVELGCERLKKRENKEFEVEGRDYCLASKKGMRDVMEDSYGVTVDVAGDPKQAFFAVIDGHGGRAAADYVAENLGNNILREAETLGKERGSPEEAIRKGYLVTDKEFLSQGVASGACAASVLLKDGHLHAANVGDCRVVLCRKGVADALTRDHRVSREDERLRIENSGGFVHRRNGVWRIHGSLAISRAIGDLHLKEWVISEPEIKTRRIMPDCEFLIMASDGLWDKVSDQEAVDLVSKQSNFQESCKKLVELACSRGNVDDITVMLINLRNFCS
ncbi:PPM-type phosphatase domain-containing protein [Psidium guajava]|nr:PPM-type phosphatase domain-containing protein [Psidium guajava]